MKKVYLIASALTLIALLPGINHAQNRISDDGELQTGGYPGGVDYLGSCDTISTTFAGGNGQDGNMFTINAKQDIIIQQFEGNIDGAGVMKIYYMWGSYVGSETNPAAWTLLDSAYVNPVGVGMPTLIPVNVNLTVDSGEVISFYITGNNSGADVDYTNGTLEGQVYSSDANIEILEGIGLGYPFSTSSTPRVWNGIVHYCPNINYCHDFTTTYAGGNGLDGAVFELNTFNEVIIKGFDAALRDTGYVFVYYKPGTYTGTLTNPGAWTLVDSVFVEGHGAGQPTEIPLNINLYIPASSTYSFIITGGGYDPQFVGYTNGAALGAVYANDNNIQIREGEGFTAPWGGGNGLPRVLNQTIHYCIPGLDTAVVCNSLMTTNAFGNANDGIMFNVVANSTQSIELESFDTYFSTTGPVEARIYYKNGSYIGSEGTPGDWTLLDSVTVNVPNNSTLIHIPIDMELLLTSGSTMGFYISTPAISSVRYTNGNAIDTVFAMDSYVRINEGQGITAFFNGATSLPRVFNGRLNYCRLQSFIGIEDMDTENGLAIWPNPNNGIFNVGLDNYEEELNRIDILDLNGRVIQSFANSINTNQMLVDISAQPSGIYLVRAYTDNNIATRKIIIQ